jgi:hypothetical protein
MSNAASTMVGALWLLGCGGRAHGEPIEEPNNLAGGAALVGGQGGTGSAAGGAGAGGALLGRSGAGGAASGSAGEPEEPREPPTHIAGRWALFSFADPVGVQLVQAEWDLTGMGCAAGTPPAGMLPNYCGDIAGKVEGNRATFGFSFESYRYQAETVISADGTRMTGRFHGVQDWLAYPTAWLRVPDEAAYLEVKGTALEPPALAGWYDLELVEGDGSDYAPGASYRLRYSRRAIEGALGSFWGTEAGDPALGSPIHVGPVPATSPELPTELQLEFGDAALREVRAKTASGNAYTFAATRAAP